MSDSDKESVRQAVERSRRGAPAAGEVVRDRFETSEIFQRIIAAAEAEIETGSRELFFSALAAGFAITLTFLAHASMYAKTGGDPLLSVILYPIGFLYIILGGYQLFTENTLPPVTLVLERLSSLPTLFHLWGIVLLGNFIGGAIGAIVLAQTGVFSAGAASAATEIAMRGVETPFWDLFYRAGFTGLIVGGVVWLDFAARDMLSRFLVVYVAFITVAVGELYHVVVSFPELVYLFLEGHVAFGPGVTGFILPVLLGNTIGGVVLVTVVNYFQTSEPRRQLSRAHRRRLSIRELLRGRSSDRSYVSNHSPDSGESESSPDSDD